MTKLRAREQGIIGVTDCGGRKKEFQIFDKDDFPRNTRGKQEEYTIKIERDIEL